MSTLTVRFIIQKADGEEIEPKSDDVVTKAAGRPFALVVHRVSDSRRRAGMNSIGSPIPEDKR